MDLLSEAPLEIPTAPLRRLSGHAASPPPDCLTIAPRQSRIEVMIPSDNGAARSVDRYGVSEIARFAAWDQIDKALDAYTAATDSASISVISKELLETIGAFGIELQRTIRAAPDLQEAGLPAGLADHLLGEGGVSTLAAYVDDVGEPQRAAAAELAITTNYLLALFTELAHRAKDLELGSHRRITVSEEQALERQAILDPASLTTIQELWIAISRALDGYFDALERVVEPGKTPHPARETAVEEVVIANEGLRSSRPGAILHAALAVTGQIRVQLGIEPSQRVGVDELATAAAGLGLGSDLPVLRRLLETAEASLNGVTPPTPAMQWVLIQAGERILANLQARGEDSGVQKS